MIINRKSLSVSWAAMSLQGLVRIKNEDNLFTPKGCLPLVHTDFGPASDSFSVKSCEKPVCLSVFDGMGGEKDGELASWLAADRCSGMDWNEVNEACLALNERVCGHSEKHRGSMGTTVAGISFGADRLRAFNVGDSRVYRLSKGRLEQISVDHVPKNSGMFRSDLTQFLGVPKEDFLIEPEITEQRYVKGDLYLLCTDGISRMINDSRLERILKDKGSLEDKLNVIKEIVFKRGAEDNATAILCEIC